jgi:hypothetical protein
MQRFPGCLGGGNGNCDRATNGDKKGWSHDGWGQVLFNGPLREMVRVVLSPQRGLTVKVPAVRTVMRASERAPCAARAFYFPIGPGALWTEFTGGLKAP